MTDVSDISAKPNGCVYCGLLGADGCSHTNPEFSATRRAVAPVRREVNAPAPSVRMPINPHTGQPLVPSPRW